jgi:hypothetical protein
MCVMRNIPRGARFLNTKMVYANTQSRSTECGVESAGVPAGLVAVLVEGLAQLCHEKIKN